MVASGIDGGNLRPPSDARDPASATHIWSGNQTTRGFPGRPSGDPATMARRTRIAGLGVPGPVPALVASAAPPPPLPGKCGALAALVQAAIADGRWPPGSVLPSERTLAATYALSRATVRAGLDRLAAAGAVERHGRRLLVAAHRAGPAPAERLRAALVLTPERLRNPVIQAVVAACRAHLGAGIALEVFIHERLHPELYRSLGTGLVFLDGSFGARAINAAAAAGLRVAVLNSFHPRLPYVFTDNRLGGMLMARHALERGHRRIALLHHGESEVHDFTQRLRGMRHELQAAGVAPLELDCGDTGDIDRLLALLLRQAPDLSLLLCLTDSLALRVLEALTVAGIAVPERISLIGYDDLPACALTHPPLTNVRQPVEDLGAALAAIARRIADGAEARLDRPISPVLVPRASVADKR
jgi:DNA-binding LacI/PurR family transcriptional regulator